MDFTMADLLARSRAARSEGRDPVERFSLLVENLVLYHTHRRELGFVGGSEMRSFESANRQKIAEFRTVQQRMVDHEVRGRRARRTVPRRPPTRGRPRSRHHVHGASVVVAARRPAQSRTSRRAVRRRRPRHDAKPGGRSCRDTVGQRPPINANPPDGGAAARVRAHRPHSRQMQPRARIWQRLPRRLRQGPHGARVPVVARVRCGSACGTLLNGPVNRATARLPAVLTCLPGHGPDEDSLHNSRTELADRAT